MKITMLILRVVSVGSRRLDLIPIKVFLGWHSLLSCSKLSSEMYITRLKPKTVGPHRSKCDGLGASIW